MRRNNPIATTITNAVTGETKSQNIKAVVPSGSVLLNLACSNSYKAAFELGRMVNLIGDSSSGKTYLALEMLAQMAMMKRFANYTFIYDDAEHALSMDIEKLFGSNLLERLKAPKYDGEDAVYSDTIEDFHMNILDALDKGPFIYILDSFDALSAEQDESKIEEMREAREKGKEIKGSYAMAKPKKSSELLRNICGKLDKTESFLLIISQTRDNIDPFSFEKKTRSGGKALKFYASHEIWLGVKSKLKQRERVIGSELKAKVSKNKLTGAVREVGFEFRHGYGADDISSCIDFLTVEQNITKSGSKLVWGNHIGVKKTLIDIIEDKNLENKLFAETETAWLAIEESLKPQRKSKYVSED